MATGEALAHGTSGPGAARRDLPALTGLRAVAATWVVLLHFQFLAGPYLDQLPVLRPLLATGWTGVELFFVLSGFVITLNYVEKVGRRPRARVVSSFVVNRFARVWPAWAAVTVVMGGWIWVLRSLGRDADVVTPHPAADWPTLLQQLAMVQMWGRQDLPGNGYVLPGWSISAEWAAYLAFPLVVLVLYRLRRLPAAVLLVAALAAMAPLSVLAFTTGTPDHQQDWVWRITCGFLAGALTALAVRRVRRTELTDSVALATVCGTLFLIAAGCYWSVWRQNGDWAHDYSGIVVVLFPLLVAGLALTDRGPARLLAARPMVYCGRLSYSLYLVHYVVLDIVLTVAWQDPAVRSLTPGVVLLVPLLVLLSGLCSVALHHLVEEPGRAVVLAGYRRLEAALTTGRDVEAAVPAPLPRPRLHVAPAQLTPAAQAPRTPARPTLSPAALAAAVAAPRTQGLVAVGPAGPLRAGLPPAPRSGRHAERLHAAGPVRTRTVRPAS
jgi:peptidoglycan/LPS O-acetylase OafA/YrhL